MVPLKTESPSASTDIFTVLVALALKVKGWITRRILIFRAGNRSVRIIIGTRRTIIGISRIYGNSFGAFFVESIDCSYRNGIGSVLQADVFAEFSVLIHQNRLIVDKKLGVFFRHAANLNGAVRNRRSVFGFGDDQLRNGDENIKLAVQIEKSEKNGNSDNSESRKIWESLIGRAKSRGLIGVFFFSSFFKLCWIFFSRSYNFIKEFSPIPKN